MVKLPDKKSLEGFTKKVGEAVKLPDKPEDKEPKPGLSQADEEKIRKDERERIEREKCEKENAEKAREYEKIEAEKQAEKERLAEEARKKKEKDEWAREEERKRLEDERNRAQIEKEVRAQQKAEAPKKGHGGKIALGIIIIIIIIILILIAAGGYVSLITGNSVLDAYGYPLSYTGTYDVLIPYSQKIDFGPIPVQAISSGNAVTLSINNDRRTISLGESTTFPAKHVIITMFGMPIYNADYEVTATYIGVVTNRDDFKVVLKTSQSIPGWLITVMKPSGVDIITI